MSRHVMECLGKARVVVENGKIIEIGEPQIEVCPLFGKHRGIGKLDKESIKENIQFRMDDFGLFTENRIVRMPDFLSFGISEILSTALKNGLIDAAVIVADGCGTAVVTDPEIVQGLCGRISAVIETSPIKTVMDAVGKDYVLNPETAEIDMLSGLGKAYSMGFRNVAVTVCDANDALSIRDVYGSTAVIMAVHTSGVSYRDAVTLFDTCDVITSCASATLRQEAKHRDVITAGNKVPVYGVSEKGKELVRARLEETGKKEWTGEPPEDPPKPLI